MKYMNNIKLISSLLIIAFIASLFACSAPESADGETDGTTVADMQESKSNTELIADYLSSLPDENYDGAEVNFLVASETLWGHEMIDAEEISGEPINDEIYARNRRVEERYSVVLNSTQEHFTSIANKISTLVQASDDAFDVYLPRLNAGIGAAQSGYLLDGSKLEYINAEMPWWDSNIIKDLSIGGKYFFLTGDIHLYANDATHIILFNKNNLNDYNLEDVYGLTENGRWTFAKMEEMSRAVVTDIDGDGKYLWGDRFGIQCANYAIPALLSAADSPVYVKKYDDSSDSSDSIETIEININSDRFNKVYTFINRTMNEDNITLNMEDSAKFNIPSGSFSHEWIEAMQGNQCLFMIGVLDYMDMFYEVESDFGIIPIPKYDENQTDYIAPVMADAIAVCVPVCTKSADMVSLVLEAMAAESSDSLKNAYYEITLQRKRSRDTESAAMLDIIFASRSYPLDRIYNWGGLSDDIIAAVKKNNSDLGSLLAKKEQRAYTDIDNTLEKYAQNG
ncbi:MAG: hypothetical protein PHZ09_08990 [Eubacteriales bacterium]|nr:hypothetical protein [Eubacteriales bacterium]